jgi:hypothetical protein
MRIDNLSVVSTDIGEITSASFLAGGTETYIRAGKTANQTISNNSSTQIINWTNLQVQNAAEWNATTGIFTATKAGTYSVSAHLFYVGSTATSLGSEVNVAINKNYVASAVATQTVYSTNLLDRPTGEASIIINLVPTDTITIWSYQNLGGSRDIRGETWRSSLSITELPGRITRA